jgi:toxin ParE1/3/4
MPSFRLSVEAAGDIEAIGDFGITTFGFTQALKYHLALESRFELLGQFPRIGSPTYDLRPGLYRYSYESHTIFYTIESDHVFIVRVLYAGADFKRHF